MVLREVTMRWFTRHRDTVVPLLVVVVAALLLANLIKHGILTASQLASNRDALAALQSAVQVVFIILGAVFSYYRFFRGRTFVMCADVSIKVEVIQASDEFNLHSLTVEFKNLGTVSIWDPKPNVNVHLIGPDGVTTEAWKNWREAASPASGPVLYAVVDSGETVSFSTYHRVLKSIWAVEYEAFVSDVAGVTWKRSATVANKVKDAK
jgi:hypothetical protein